MNLTTVKSDKIYALFADAMCSAATYIHDFNVNCSQSILFVGFNENETTPLQIWYNTKGNTFCMSFSVYYMQNPTKKIKNYFIRYIIGTNSDGTFKNFNEILAELKKINGEYFTSTLSSNYLTSSSKVKKKPNVICRTCRKTFAVTEEMGNNISDYICDCGGELTKLDTYEPSAFAKESYLSGKYKSKSKSINVDEYTDEFFITIPHSEQDLDDFIAFLQNKTRLTKTVLISELEKIIDNNRKNLLAMYNFAFPSIYQSAYASMKVTYKDYINKHSPIVEVKTKDIPQLNREDFNCTDSEFEQLQQYNKGRKCSKAMRPLLTEAINNNNRTFIESLIVVDQKSCKALQRYLKLSDRKYLDTFFKKGE
jgi:hypothetical protein